MGDRNRTVLIIITVVLVVAGCISLVLQRLYSVWRGIETVESEDTPLMDLPDRSWNPFHTAVRFAENVAGSRSGPHHATSASTHADLYIYANSSPSLVSGLDVASGWKVTSVYAAKLPLLYIGGRDGAYRYNIKLESANVGSLPEQLDVKWPDALRGDVRAYRDPYDRKAARLPVYSNYWRYHHATFMPAGTAVSVLPPPSRWTWVAAVAVQERGKVVKDVVFTPTPALIYFHRSIESTGSNVWVASWFPRENREQLECRVNYSDGSQRRVKLPVDSTVPGLRLVSKLPGSMATELPTKQY